MKLSVRRMAASRVFSRVLLFYLVLVLFFGGVCCAAYFWTTETNVERLVERNRLVFENSAIGLSNTFSTIESFTETLYDQKELQTLMGSTARERGNLTIGIYKTIEELPLLSDSSGIIGGYFVYLPAADVIIAPKQGYVGMRNTTTRILPSIRHSPSQTGSARCSRAARIRFTPRGAIIPKFSTACRWPAG